MAASNEESSSSSRPETVAQRVSTLSPVPYAETKLSKHGANINE